MLALLVLVNSKECIVAAIAVVILMLNMLLPFAAATFTTWRTRVGPGPKTQTLECSRAIPARSRSLRGSRKELDPRPGMGSR